MGCDRRWRSSQLSGLCAAGVHPGSATTCRKLAFFIHVRGAVLRHTIRTLKGLQFRRIKGRPSGNESVRPQDKEGPKLMPLLQVIEVLIVVGVLLWLVNRFIPMQSSIKSILNGVVVIAVVLWLLNAFGLFHSFSHMRIGS
jgi:hypothetical protein